MDLSLDMYDKLQDPNVDVHQVFKELGAGISGHIYESNADGGGFTLASGKRGVTSQTTRDRTWVFRCRSSHSNNCPKQIRLVLRSHAKTIHLEDATGWEHSHAGESRLTRGLSHSVKSLIDKMVSESPGLKYRAVCNSLFEHHGIDPALKDSIRNYYYNGCTARTSMLDLTTGISSFGCMATFGRDHDLFDMMRGGGGGKFIGGNKRYCDIPGVVAYGFDPSEDRAFVLVSTFKLLVGAWLQGTMGYGRGQWHQDYTFKMLQEQVPFFTSAVADIRQHVHACAIGPSTHMDEQAGIAMLQPTRSYVERAVRMIYNPDDEMPREWPATLRAQLLLDFQAPVRKGVAALYGSTVVRSDTITFEPRSSMQDNSGALRNAATKTFGSHVQWHPTLGGSPLVDQYLSPASHSVEHTALTCWVHLWMALKKNHYRLKENTEDRQRELYNDLDSVHLILSEGVAMNALDKLYYKWEHQFNEKDIVDYIRKEWPASLKWMRCFHSPGEPGDNNIDESLNKMLKCEDAFGKTTSVGLALQHSLTVIHRLSRDSTFISTVTAPVPDKNTWAKAQKLVEQSYFKLAFKLGAGFIVPSAMCLNQCPETTVNGRRTNLRTWAQEFCALMKNPDTYSKANGPNSWDFDTLIDYAFSFWILQEITPDNHPSAEALAQAGVVYTCTCPQFLHYYNCKHSLGFGLFQQKICVPTTFSTATVGRRRAGAGAKTKKRAHCMLRDD